MGGFFGCVSHGSAIRDVFYGTDYHSHLGAHRAGMSVYDKEVGLQRELHSIENSPFRTKFENVYRKLKGTSGIGCISDHDPQPLLIRSKLGTYALCYVGLIGNANELIDEYLQQGGHFDAKTGGEVNTVELLSVLISQGKDFVEGIKIAQDKIQGSASIIILKDDGSIIAARDKFGRLPIAIGKREDGYAVSFESFAYRKLGYDDERELGPGEIVELTPNGITQLAKPGKEMRVCSFLWSYYGYPTSTYEGVNVEVMRYRNGAIMAENDKTCHDLSEIDYVGGVPDSGTPHAIGYANKSGIPFARAFIKYTPTWARSFTPAEQTERDKIAEMKQIPIHDFIQNKNLLFVDDSIVRGTQIKKTVNFLYENGAKAVHMRSACPPIMFGCKYLNFSRATSDMELIARQVIMELEGEEGFKYIEEYSDGNTERGKNLRKKLCEKLKLTSIDFQSLEGVIKAIGLDPCKLCTYCWNGKE
ncbi:MAG: amidophosphoribosyltransferase [Clostridiales bacterium]|nr:amidophosphoribosyltransferase [Clostridiales bacterium]